MNRPGGGAWSSPCVAPVGGESLHRFVGRRAVRSVADLVLLVPVGFSWWTARFYGWLMVLVARGSWRGLGGCSPRSVAFGWRAELSGPWGFRQYELAAL